MDKEKSPLVFFPRIFFFFPSKYACSACTPDQSRYIYQIQYRWHARVQEYNIQLVYERNASIGD